MTSFKIFVLLVSMTCAHAQRPSFAGSKPIGYPEVIKPTTETLGNRFGEEDGTTQRLPIEANGDRDLIDRLSKLPVDQQPFWFINWQAYEAQRLKPQTYPQKPNVFVESQNNGNPQNQFISPNNGQMNPNRFPNRQGVSPQGSQYPGNTNFYPQNNMAVNPNNFNSGNTGFNNRFGSTRPGNFNFQNKPFLNSIGPQITQRPWGSPFKHQNMNGMQNDEAITVQTEVLTEDIKSTQIYTSTENVKLSSSE